MKKYIIKKIKRFTMIILLTIFLGMFFITTIKISIVTYDVDDCMLQYVNNHNATGGYYYIIDDEPHVELYNESLKHHIKGKFDGCYLNTGNFKESLYNTVYCYLAKYLPKGIQYKLGIILKKRTI